MKGLLLLLGSLISTTTTAAPQNYWPQKIIWFTTSHTTESQIRNVKNSVGNASLKIFKVDEARKVMSQLENSVPQWVLSKPKDEVQAYLKEHISPKIKETFPQVLSAKIGAGIASMYGVERIPAVVLDGQYIVYGASVRKAIHQYQWQKDKEANAIK